MTLIHARYLGFLFLIMFYVYITSFPYMLLQTIDCVNTPSTGCVLCHEEICLSKLCLEERSKDLKKVVLKVTTLSI